MFLLYLTEFLKLQLSISENYVSSCSGMQAFSYLHSLGVIKSLMACWAFTVLSFLTLSLLGLKLGPMMVLGKCYTDLHSQLPPCCITFLARSYCVAQAGLTFNSLAQTPNYRHKLPYLDFYLQFFTWVLSFCFASLRQGHTCVQPKLA